jgi:hypothetical protein
MKVDVAAFEAAVGRSGQAAILMSNDGTTQVTIPAAPGSNSRYDVVWVKQNDAVSPNADADSLPTFGVTSGSAAPSPVEATVLAAIPAGALPLASLLIPSGVSATNAGGVVITQKFPYSTTTGSPLWVRNATELAALTIFQAGTEVYRLDVSTKYVYLGGVWRPVGLITAGSTSTRDSIFVSPQLGDVVFRSDKGYSQIYYTATNGVATAGWYAEPGITYTVIPGTINPVPNAVTDYNALTFTLGANELMVVQVDFMAGAQHNIAMTSFWRVLLGAVVQATIDFNFTTGNQNMPGYRQVRIVLPASTASTIKNQAFASAASNAVFNGAGMTIKTISPVTLA